MNKITIMLVKRKLEKFVTQSIFGGQDMKIKTKILRQNTNLRGWICYHKFLAPILMCSQSRFFYFYCGFISLCAIPGICINSKLY